MEGREMDLSSQVHKGTHKREVKQREGTTASKNHYEVLSHHFLYRMKQIAAEQQRWDTGYRPQENPTLLALALLCLIKIAKYIREGRATEPKHSTQNTMPETNITWSPITPPIEKQYHRSKIAAKRKQQVESFTAWQPPSDWAACVFITQKGWWRGGALGSPWRCRDTICGSLLPLGPDKKTFLSHQPQITTIYLIKHSWYATFQQ